MTQPKTSFLCILPVFSALFTLTLLPDAHANVFLYGFENQFKNRGLYDFTLNTKYFSSSTNFNEFGVNQPSTGLSQLSRIEEALMFRYGFADRFSFFTRLTWAYINQNATVRGGTGFGPADQTIGLTYRAFGHPTLSDSEAAPFSLDLHLQTDIPAYSTTVAEANQTPYLGDGTIDTTAGLFATLPIFAHRKYSLRTTLGAGYTYRTGDFSASIPGSILVEYLPETDGLYAALSGLGMFSLKTDPNNGTLAPLRTHLGSSGSFFTGAVNPSILQIRGQVGYRFETDTSLLLGASLPIWGQSAPSSFSFDLAFSTRLGGRSKNNPILLTPKSYGQSNQGFINYSLDAHIIRANDRLNLVKIDKGSDDGIEVGQIFDIFTQTRDGNAGESVARGEITHIKGHEAVVNITDYYKEVWIENGFIAKRLVQAKEIE